MLVLLASMLLGTPPASPADRVDRARLRASVERFQAHGSRMAGTAGVALAGDQIEQQLQAWGLEVRRQRFGLHSEYAGRQVPAENLIVRLGPATSDRWVLVAHLDARGAADPKAAKASGWRWDRDPAPGADDNASGCAALLEVARILRDVRLVRGVDLVWSGGEELARMTDDGFMANLGAEPLAETYVGAEPLGVIAVDMLLRPTGYGYVLRIYADGRWRSSLLSDALREAAWQFSPTLLIDVRVSPGFTYSDHGSFWARGIGGVLLIEDDFHHVRYHRPDDRYDEDGFYDLGQLEAATRMLVAATVQLALHDIGLGRVDGREVLIDR